MENHAPDPEAELQATLTPILRPALPDDETFLFRLYVSTRKDEMAAWGWSEEHQQFFLQMQYNAQQSGYRAQYAQAESQIIVVQGQDAGRLFAARSAGEIHLVDIALLPEYRGAGIGTVLIGALLDEARSNGQSVHLHVLRENRARRLYERLGFTVSDDDQLYLAMQWRPHSSE